MLQHLSYILSIRDQFPLGSSLDHAIQCIMIDYTRDVILCNPLQFLKII